MTEQSSFSSGPDRALGAELRAALDTNDSDVFIQHLKHVVGEAGVESSWEVLARWAPGGFVAAAGAAAALIWFLGWPAVQTVPATPLASAPVQIEAAPAQPEAVVITVAVMEGR